VYPYDGQAGLIGEIALTIRARGLDAELLGRLALVLERLVESGRLDAATAATLLAERVVVIGGEQRD
jgi:hypothetical protein